MPNGATGEIQMASIYDVNQNALIEKVAKELAKSADMKAPA